MSNIKRWVWMRNQETLVNYEKIPKTSLKMRQIIVETFIEKNKDMRSWKKSQTHIHMYTHRKDEK